ncbi:MAG: hypothetical protein CVV49_18755, partial [Spirochaetae bacterium HGW-Spirochaetae-5]
LKGGLRGRRPRNPPFSVCGAYASLKRYGYCNNIIKGYLNRVYFFINEANFFDSHMLPFSFYV